MRQPMKRLFIAAMLGLTSFTPLMFSNVPTVNANQKVFRTITPADAQRAKELRQQADEERMSGHYADAIRDYTSALHLDDRIGGFAGRAFCFLQQGDYDAAEQDAFTSISHQSADDLLNPELRGMAEYVHALCAYHRGDYIQAKEDTTSVIGTSYAETDAFRQLLRDVGQKAQQQIDTLAAQKFLDEAKPLIDQLPPPAELKAYDLLCGDDTWWSDQSTKQAIEQQFGPISTLTQNLWFLNAPDRKAVVAFVPRRVSIAYSNGIQYNDTLLMYMLYEYASDTISSGMTDDLKSHPHLQWIKLISIEDNLPRFLRVDGTQDVTWGDIVKNATREETARQKGHDGSPAELASVSMLGSSVPTDYYVMHSNNDRGIFVLRAERDGPIIGTLTCLNSYKTTAYKINWTK